MQPDNTDPSGGPRKVLTRTKIKIVILLLVAGLIVTMICQNWGQVDTAILFTTIRMPRVALTAIWLLLGFVIGLITPGVLRHRRKRH